MMEGMKSEMSPAPRGTEALKAPDQRREDGQEALQSYVRQIRIALPITIGSFNGLVSDIQNSKNSGVLGLHFKHLEKIAEPAMKTVEELPVLAESLENALSALDGGITLSLVRGEKDAGLAAYNLKRIHEDIARVVEYFGVLHGILINALFEFDSFNGAHAGKEGYEDVDIVFDRQAMDTSILLSKDVAEKAFRLDRSIFDLIENLREAEALRSAA